MKVVSLDSAAEKKIQSLISAAKQDPEQWYALDTFVSHLADTSLVRHSPINDLRYTTRIPAGSYLLFSPDKGNAFIKLLDLKSDTVLTLTMDDHVSN
ncbi:hypothetical protein BGE01nite_54810 [Brevifollis gellanilyticus]|uniref:Uncharacterized protein n=2 Tax=Brevifollis gellanilyticus TaxID=748831 RepID=A0A512MHI1_9BACT|nr:hypothetical protein BGE01nite_54810 [Brevifollis gellanilyticus]